MNKIFVVSDGSGGTAKRALSAALIQFEGANIEIVEKPNVRTNSQLEAVVKEAAQSEGFIIHTLVSNHVRNTMLRACRLHNIPAFDLMGPLLDRLSQQLSIKPAMKPGLFQQLNEEYFRRIESMEFAFHHDDGLRSQELDRAEIILVGVSRTFKTPLSIYLAFKGWFVANIPVVLDMPLPTIINNLSPGTVFGLKSDPYRLAELRLVREERLNRVTGDYAKPDHVCQEMKYAMNLFDQHPDWPVIDVTSKPIEEIASEILAHLK
jgi:regulator of PEP synthase PpsR (kinase-PPPase family)